MQTLNIPFNSKRIISLAVAALFTLITLLMLVQPAPASAAVVTSRKLTLGSSAVSTRTTHTFDFTAATTANIGSMSFEYCLEASGGTCTAPTGFNTEEASLALGTQVGATGFTVHANTTTNEIVITRSAVSLPATTAVTIPFGTGTGSTNGPTNPSTTNQYFFVRISTYTSTDGTGSATDTGVVAASTAEQINFTATVDESIVFCTGTSGITSSSCSGASGSTVAFGNLSSSQSSTGTSQIGVGTNNPSGFVITVNGGTLTCSACVGTPTISAIGGTAAASSEGASEQFGFNLVLNNGTPAFGTDPQGAGDSSPTANYGTANSYAFATGNTIVSDTDDSEEFRLFTAAYIANITAATEAGAYTAAFTYIATATF